MKCSSEKTKEKELGTYVVSSCCRRCKSCNDDLQEESFVDKKEGRELAF